MGLPIELPPYRADDDAHIDFLRFIERVASRYSAAILDRLLELLPR